MPLPQNNLSSDRLASPAEFPEIITIEAVPFLLEHKRKELFQAHKDVLAFLDEAHTAEETKVWEKQIRQYESALVGIREVLDVNIDAAPDKLFKTHDYLVQEVRTITSDLREDRKGLEQKKKESEFDLFKLLSYGVVVPSIAHSHLKARYPDNPLIANIGFTGIFLVGVGFHLRSHIKQAWELAKKDITPRDIKNSVGFTVYYAKHSVIEKTQAAKVGAKKISKQVRESVAKMNPIRKLNHKDKKPASKNELL